jgi:hypothetical protein
MLEALMTGCGPCTQGLQFIRSWLSVWTSGKFVKNPYSKK